MRTIIAAFIFTMLIACSWQHPYPAPVTDPMQVAEASFLPVPVVDSIQILKDSIGILTRQLEETRVLIKYDDFDARFRLARIRKYVAICDMRPANKKYFFGWIKRAIK